MKISFIVTYHNEPLNMLSECLRSIASLPVADKEIIVIDDGSEVSPDASVTSVGADVRLIRQDNKGLSAARNRGMECATGNYIQFVDADDMLLPEYAAVIHTLEQHHPDVLQFCFTRHYSATKKPVDITFDGTGLQRLSTYNLRAAAWSYVFNRRSLGNIRFQEGIYHEDELFTPLLFLQAERIIDTNAQAYFYRQRCDSITTTHDDSKIQKRLDDTHYVIKTLSDMDNTALTRRISQLTMDYMYNIVKLTGNFNDFCHRCRHLKQQSLLPLPLRFYSAKYFLFALFTRLLLR